LKQRSTFRQEHAEVHEPDDYGAKRTERRLTLQGVNFQRLEGDRVVEHTMVGDFGTMQALRS
jgi:hypothetical protein